MGREAQVCAEWQGATGRARALLESQELILRGEIRARIPRAGIVDVRVTGSRLTLSSAGETLALHFGFDAQTDGGPVAAGRAAGGAGAVEAQKWATALVTPPPTLAQKLGVDPEHLAYLLGDAGEGPLRDALAGATTERLAEAALIVAVLEQPGQLERAADLAESAPGLPLWCLYAKGGVGAVTDASVREALRARGFVDTKASAVSARLTATRYSRRV